MGRDLEARKKKLAPARPEMLFLVILHYKMRKRPAQARARSEPGPKVESQHVPWTVMGRIFSARKTRVFFSTGPKPDTARPVKCSGLVTAAPRPHLLQSHTTTKGGRRPQPQVDATVEI
jgi:hypothetical protein